MSIDTNAHYWAQHWQLPRLFFQMAVDPYCSFTEQAIHVYPFRTACKIFEQLYEHRLGRT